MNTSALFMKNLYNTARTANDTHSAIKGKRVDRVSKKFYDDINGRIRTTVYQFGCAHDVYASAKIAIDRYISDGTEPDVSNILSVRLIFSLLKPEIDKAMKRSRMAKDRAAARRSAKTGGATMREASIVSTTRDEEKDAVTQETETAQQSEPTTDVTADHTHTSSTTTANEDNYWRPLNRRERRTLKRERQKLKKRSYAKRANQYMIQCDRAED